MNDVERAIITLTQLLEQHKMSAFDSATFLNASTQEAGETQYTPVPACEAKSIIEKVAGKAVTNSKTQEEMIILDVRFEVLDDEIRELLAMDKVMVTQGYFCDLTSDGLLDWGTNKNIALGRLRDAVGQNVDGEPWAPGMLEGAGPLTIMISVEEDNNGVPRNRVKSTTALTA